MFILYLVSFAQNFDLRFKNIVKCSCSLLIFIVHSIFIWIYSNAFIHATIGGHLSCLQILAVMYHATLNIFVYIFLEHIYMYF